MSSCFSAAAGFGFDLKLGIGQAPASSAAASCSSRRPPLAWSNPASWMPATAGSSLRSAVGQLARRSRPAIRSTVRLDRPAGYMRVPLLVGQVGDEAVAVRIAAQLSLPARLENIRIGQPFPHRLAGLVRHQQDERRQGIDCRRCQVFWVLIQLDFFAMPVGDVHADCLDLLLQNADHIALAGFRIPLSPLNSGGWRYHRVVKPAIDLHKLPGKEGAGNPTLTAIV